MLAFSDRRPSPVGHHGCHFSMCLDYFMLLLLFLFGGFTPLIGQSSWQPDEVDEILTLAKTDVPGAVALIGSRSTPYDFGIKALLQAGEGDKAINWFNMLTVETNDFKYLYGAAWSKWKTGENKGALKDALYLSHQELSPLLQAR
ncbi:MAG: hypothetical protein QNK37_22180, partial [Acidobacteriota bacterium]|nr:hypothetical protein [Acidobacteriota bacterium]